MLQHLEDEVLALVLEFGSTRDVESFTVAWRHIGEQVLPKFPIVWKKLFAQQWNALNFGINESEMLADLQADPQLFQLFANTSVTTTGATKKKATQKKTSCSSNVANADGISESRLFQLLTHAITSVPSFADLQTTNLFTGRAPILHIVEPIAIEATIVDDDEEVSDAHGVEQHMQDANMGGEGNRHAQQRTIGTRVEPKVARHRRRSLIRNRNKVIAFAFGGYFLGGDRSVRANVPFSMEPRVVVYKVKSSSLDGENDQSRANNASSDMSDEDDQHAFVGLACSGYFEITILPRPRPSLVRYAGVDMTSIGMCTSRFHLIDKQPGWDDQSYGYHGDDGKFFHATSNGRRFGPSFGILDVVGCGVLRDHEEKESTLFFTKNGQLIERRRLQMDCHHNPLFPVVGLDSPHVIQVNFGQMPFKYDFVERHVKPELLRYGSLMTSSLPWNRIIDEGSFDDHDDDDDDDDDNDRYENFDDDYDDYNDDDDYEPDFYEDLEELMDHEESRAFFEELVEEAAMQEDEMSDDDMEAMEYDY